MDRVKVGIIGVGLWGVNHLEAYLGLPQAEVIAVADPAPGRAETIAKQFNIPRWFQSFEDLCAVKELDAVSIVSPEAEHLKPVEAAAEAGKHILLEKPIAYSVTDAEQMISAARKAGVILMPGHLLRLEARYALIKEALDNHELGSVVSIQSRRNRTKGTFKKYARAHPIFAVAVHDIDLLLWYAQSEVRASEVTSGVFKVDRCRIWCGESLNSPTEFWESSRLPGLPLTQSEFPATMHCD